MRIPAQCLLNLQSETLHSATHIGPAHRQPDPHLARDRDHETPRAFTIAAASVGGVVSGIRSRTLPATSSSITTGGGSGWARSSRTSSVAGCPVSGRNSSLRQYRLLGATLFAVSQEERKVTLELRSVAPRAFCLWRQRAQASPSFFLSSAFSFRSRSARSFFRRAFSSSSFTRSLSSSLCVVCPAALFQ